jgi:hypothetical protein
MFLLEQIATSIQHNNSIAAKDQEHQQEQPQHYLKIGIDASLIG